jgi:isoquinoline 1-oxidoreductase subunit beta
MSHPKPAFPMNQLPRRDFLKLSGLSGAALALGFLPQAKAEVVNLAGLADAASFEIGPFIIIEKTGKITLVNPRPDMGQGTQQSIPMLVAEELEVGLDQVEVVASNGDARYGAQLSGGSGSVRASWVPMRKAGAAAREMLVQAAANQWKVAPADCQAENGRVLNRKTKASVGYGELVEAAAKLPVPKEPKLKGSQDFKLIGKSVPRQDIGRKVDGTEVYGLDATVPGMLYASVAMNPAIWGKVATLDDRRAKAVAGVRHVVKVNRPVFDRTAEGVAVLADSYYAATQGRKALRVSWETTAHDQFNNAAYFQQMRGLAKAEGLKFEAHGDAPAALKTAAKVVEAIYETPFAAHAPMEPEAVLAHYKADGTLELWAPVQSPDTDWGGARGDLAKALGIGPEKIKLHVLMMGGAFGRKAFYDFLMQAAFLSREVKAPVKLIWTREDDVTQGPFRPAMLNVLRGGLDASGQVVALHHTVVGGSIQHQWGGLKAGQPDNWAPEAVDHENAPYTIPHFRLDYHHAETSVPLLWWRSVYASTNAFAHESFMDELAHAAGKDPLAFRLALLAGAKGEVAERLRAVLDTVAQKTNWAQKPPTGQARGLAVVRSFSTICAQVVYVAKTADGPAKIEKVVSVIDCGIAVNPDNVRAQTEGNIVYGLSAAVKDAITFAQGQAQQSNFNNYRVLRINETPPIEVHIMPNQYPPSGAGEPGLPPVAPALANALFALNGQRHRTLPLALG